MRIGSGFDVHPFAVDRKLVLGGEIIPYEKGLLGHSDADVLVHALMDAILGALCRGDIGHYFPPDSAVYHNADSMKLLAKVVEMMEKDGYSLGNADITVIAEKPKMAPYLISIRKRLAAALKTDITQVNVKATTTEKLGFTGREEGIAALATVLLK